MRMCQSINQSFNSDNKAHKNEQTLKQKQTDRQKEEDRDILHQNLRRNSTN